MKALSDKTWVLILFGGDRHFITEQQAEAIKQSISRGDKYIDLGTTFFATNQFSKLIHGSEYEASDRRRKGEYFCESHTQWIPRGKTCGHC